MVLNPQPQPKPNPNPNQVRQLQDERDQRDADEDAKLQQVLATHESSFKKTSVAGSFKTDGSGSPTKKGEVEFDFDAAENQVHLGPYS